MRVIADHIREREQAVIGFLYEEIGRQEIDYVVFVGEKYINKYPANKLIKEINIILEGGGGGRPHIAEGGGGTLKKIPDVIAFIKNKLKI